MKVSLNWVRQFTDVELATEDLVKKIGEQLGAVEEVIVLGPKYENVVIAEVKTCEKHPDADKLSICMIDDGGVVENVERTDGLVQVVCGAPNVKAGMKVAWLPPGSTVPSTYSKDPFVLEARELRGKVSNGMLASMKELAIGDSHEGILEVDVPADIGQKFADVYQLNDTIIDIENKMFTHRPDCFGQLGVAREIAGITHKQFTSPDWYTTPLEQDSSLKTQRSNELKLVVQNDIPDLVPRFVCVPIAGVDVKESPVMIQSFLSRVEAKPINNIVDITNYIMLLTGQPLHAYDYDKVVKLTEGEGAVIKAQHGDGKMKVKLLNGKTLAPRSSDIVIATDSQIVGVGGVMGGAETEVDENTKNVILECGNFDMYTIRRTSMGLGLFTDAVTRFNKGQSPLQNDTVLEEALAMILSLAGGSVAGDVQDAKGEVDLPNQVEVEASFVSERLGEPISADDIKKLLSNVEFNVELHGEKAVIDVPFWRTDIEIREDIVEEVGRLMGFHHLPVNLPNRSMQPVKKDRLLELKLTIRDILSAAGGNELLTYSFVHGDLIDSVGQDKEKAFKIANALSPDLQYYRMSIVPSLLDKVYGNSRAKHQNFLLFEIGKAHLKDFKGEDGLPKEEERLGGVLMTDDKHPAHYHAQLYVTQLLDRMGIRGAEFETIDHPFEFESGKQCLAPFEQERTAVVKLGSDVLGIVGEFNAKTRKALKLPKSTAGFELTITRLLEANKFIAYKALSKYPSVQQDISLQVPKDLSFGKLSQFLRDNLEVSNDLQWHLEPIDIYEKAEDKHVTFRLTIASSDRTLKADEVNSMLDDLAEKAKTTLNTKRL